MSLTKRHIENLIDEGKLCQTCMQGDEHDFEECAVAYRYSVEHSEEV